MAFYCVSLPQSLGYLLLICIYKIGASTSELVTDIQFSKNEVSEIDGPFITKNTGKYKNECKLKVANESLELFTHACHYRDLAFVYLQLCPQHGLEIDGLPRTVYHDLWIWTYRGDKGGFEFLSWPMDFGIWSLGILYSFVDGPFAIDLYNVSGDCTGLKVGDTLTDFVIARALDELTTSLIETYGGDAEDRYETTYFCHKSKIWIEDTFVYDLCRNLICPLEALEHKCHSFVYRSKVLTSHERSFTYNDLWWIGPMVLGIMLVSVCPLVILKAIYSWNDYFNNNMETIGDHDENLIYLDGSNHITIPKVLLCPLLKQKIWSFRVVRCVLPLIGLSFIGVQILLDYLYLHDLVLEAVAKDIHMGFRSMLAGYTASSRNFLPMFGGPFIACCLYVVIFSILLLTPKQIEKALEKGLKGDRQLQNVCPLCLNMQILERFGAVMLRNKQGYKKVYYELLANLNMCLNLDFWKFYVSLQRDRWKNAQTSVSTSLSLLLFPFFICVCVLEILLCVLVYGTPILSFCIIIFRAYRLGFRQGITGRIHKPIIWVIEVTLFLCIAFFLFMFCTIFLDACHFIARVCIFTFTGIVVYPTRAYGYLIFILTVVFYLVECFNNFAGYYNKIFRLVIEACQSVQKEYRTEKLVHVNFQCKGISRKLFIEVINAYSPIRTRIFVSLLLFALTMYILGMSVRLIIQRDELHDLHTIMNVFTLIFVCSFPKLFKSIVYSSGPAPRNNRRNELREIKTLVKRCLGYFPDEEINETASPFQG